MRTRKPTVIVSALLAAAILASCTSIPGESSPEAISFYAPEPDANNVPEPQEDQPADLLLRDFISASAHPTGSYGAAKKFLTEESAGKWQTNAPVVVLERIDVASAASENPEELHFNIRGNIVGNLAEGGEFTPEFSAFESTYSLIRVDGQWRINSLPNVVVIERSDFNSNFSPRQLYFLNPAGNALVPDTRWLYNDTANLSVALVNLLASGPKQRMRGGVRNFVPTGATVQIQNESVTQGLHLNFLGSGGEFSNEALGNWELLVAQVVWTLASADIRGPYQILADGANPLPERAQWNLQDVATLDPQSENFSGMRAVTGGRIYEARNIATADSLVPVNSNSWLSQRWVESLAVSYPDEVFAAVTGQGDEPRNLMVGERNTQPSTVYQAETLTRPSWSADSTMFYSVANGTELLRFNRNLATGQIQQTSIDTSVVAALSEEEQRISVFRVAPDGVRVLLIVNGKLYTAVLEQAEDSRLQLGQLVAAGVLLGDTVVSADWTQDGDIIVGTRANDAPIWRISSDGSQTTQLSSQNLTAPVVAVAAVGNMYYATDSRALMQYNADAEGTRFWREFPLLRGERAVPVLAY